MSNTFSAAMAVCGVEEDLLKMKQILCDGSMLKGYNAKRDGSVDIKEAKHQLGLLMARVGILEEAIRRMEG